MNDATRPVFIVGSPRSGTSILSWCLGQHPNLLVLEETNWIGKFAVELGSTFELGSARGERSQLSSVGITQTEFYEHFGDAINDLILRHRTRPQRLPLQQPGAKPAPANPAFQLARSPDEPKRRWVDGTPEYSLYIVGLLKLFPRAQFIHILRDVASVVKSMLGFSDLAGSCLVESEQAAYEYWLRTVRACVLAEQAFGSGTMLRVKYAELVNSPEAVLRRGLDFLGESNCAACLEPLATRINSSAVPADFNSFDPKTDPLIRDEAERLSRQLMEEADPQYLPDQEKRSDLEAAFAEHCRFVGSLAAERRRALEALKKAKADLAERDMMISVLRRQPQSSPPRARSSRGPDEQPSK